MKKFFTLFAIAMIAFSASAQNHALKLTQAEAKANPWDTQVFIKVKNLEPNTKYTVYFDVLGESSFNISTEEIDDVQTDHKDPYNASGVFNYTENVDVTTTWSTGHASFKGITNVNCSTEGHDATHSNFEFAATALLIGAGKTAGALYIDNVVVKNEAGNVVYTQDFESNPTLAEYDTSTDAHYPGWQGATWTIVEVEGPTGLHNIEAENGVEMFNILGQRVYDAKGLVIINGKKTIIK